MVQTYGPPSFFVTISLDDTHSPHGIRLSIGLTDGNESFPAVEDNLMEHLRASVQEFHGQDISPKGLSQLLAGNPVAASSVFMDTIHAFTTIVLGMDLGKKTKTPCQRRMGALGKVIQHFFVVETQGRGSLHAHGLLFTEASPALMQALVGSGVHEAAVLDHFDATVVSELPASQHIINRLLPQTGVKSVRPAIRTPLPTNCTQMDIDQAAIDTVSFTGIHRHTETCKKGVAGRQQCRLAFKRPRENEMRFVQLSPLASPPSSAPHFERQDDDNGHVALQTPVVHYNDHDDDAHNFMLQNPTGHTNDAQTERRFEHLVAMKPLAAISLVILLATLMMPLEIPPWIKFAFLQFLLLVGALYSSVINGIGRGAITNDNNISRSAERHTRQATASVSHIEDTGDGFNDETATPDSHISDDNAASAYTQEYRNMRVQPPQPRAPRMQPTIFDPIPLGECRMLSLELRRPECKIRAEDCLHAKCHLMDMGVDSSNAVIGLLDEYMADPSMFRDVHNMIRDCDNQYVVETNKVVSALMRCNTNVAPLGCLQQAKAVLMYISTYITKNRAPLTQALALLPQAIDDASSRVSVADDAGTSSRFTCNTLQRVLNLLTAANGEFSASQACYTLLGGKSCISSAKFTYIHVKDALAYCESHRSAILSSQEQSISVVNDSSLPTDRADDIDAVNADTAADADNATNDVDESNVQDSFVDFEESVRVIEQGRGSVNTFGSSTIYMVNGSPIACTQQSIYASRPEQLDWVPYFLFCRLFALIPISPMASEHANEEQPEAEEAEAARNPRRAGRHRNARYHLESDHPLASSHELLLRSFYPALILADGLPPPWPGPKPESHNSQWNSKALSYAGYMLVLCQPWSKRNVADRVVSWDAFTNYVCELNADSSALSNHILAYIHAITHGLRVNRQEASLQAVWRNRATDSWRTAASDDSDVQATANRVINELQASVPSMQDVAASLEARAAVDIAADVLRSFLETHGTALRAEVSPNMSHRSSFQLGRASVQNARRVSSSVLSYTSGPINETVRERHPLASTATVSTDLRGMDLLNALNEQQRAAALSIINGVLSRESRSTRLLIHGGPGVGKTFMIRTVQQVLQLNNLGEIALTAFTACAAAQLGERAATMHSRFALARNGTCRALTVAKKQQLTETLRKCSVILIDEISMCSAKIMGAVVTRITELFTRGTNNFVFILMGDLFQIRPTNGLPLYKAVLKENIRDPMEATGALFFASCKKIELYIQQRASEDQPHQQWISRLRNEDFALDTTALNHIPLLAGRDLEDPLWEEESTVLVASNALRSRINYLRLKRFALRHGKPILTWRYPMKLYTLEGSRHPQLSEIEQGTLLANDGDQLRGYYVENAPVVLTENISANLPIYNNKEGRLHSLVYSAIDIETERQIAAAQPGDEIELPSAPTYINVTLSDVDPSSWPSSATVIPGQVVIPLSAAYEKIQLSHPPSPQLRRDAEIFRFPVDLSFAVTYHRSQGRTLTRVLLALNANIRPQVALEMFYVGATRVKSVQHLRRLPLPLGQTFSHLLGLKFPCDLFEFLKSYDDSGNWARSRAHRMPQPHLRRDGQPSRTARPSRRQTTTIYNTQTTTPQDCGSPPRTPAVLRLSAFYMPLIRASLGKPDTTGEQARAQQAVGEEDWGQLVQLYAHDFNLRQDVRATYGAMNEIPYIQAPEQERLLHPATEDPGGQSVVMENPSNFAVLSRAAMRAVERGLCSVDQ